MVLTALGLGKPVITANKALLSAHGEELFAAAKKNRTNLYYEASVCGGIPIIKSLREGFVGNRITHLYGIVNGTCNYILTRMKLEGADFDAVLKDAQAQGYAEAEPSLDVDGYDAQHKIGILASLAHGFWVKPGRIYVEGIRAITRLDMQYAGQLGYTIKLLGIIKAEPDGTGGRTPRIQVSVYPTLVPNSHVLASVNHVFNAVFVRGDVVGDLARDLDARAVYPFDMDPPWPFLTWARAANAGHISPLGLNIHPAYGLWHAYRAALLFPVAFDLPRLSAGLGILNRADMWAGVDNTVVLPGYTRVDAALFYSLTEQIRVQANVENVLDRRYYINAHGNNNISPGFPRAVRLGIIAKL